jgi:DNA polymerase III alpha subunit
LPHGRIYILASAETLQAQTLNIETLAMDIHQITRESFGTKIFPLFPSIQNGIDNSLSRQVLTSSRGLSRPACRFSTREVGKPVGIGFDIYNYRMLFNDEATKRIIREGDSIGCFYIESPGMRSLLKKMKSDTFEMLTAISSVIRPGVAESGMMAEFVARHHDPKRRKYLVPELEHILGETYGVMIYQEDVIKVAHYVAGLSLEEADLLRRAMSGKMRSHDAMSRIKDKFFNHCLKKYSEEITAELWRQIESFAGYAFCKAHSASFALLSFQNAYLKAHYPAEFMSSVLSNQGGYYSPAVYIQESKRLGLKVLLPDINESEIEYTGHEGWIRIGLMAIKNLSTNSMNTIVDERNRYGGYKSLSDFLRRTSIGYAEAAILIQCGAMDCFNNYASLDTSQFLPSQSVAIGTTREPSLRSGVLDLTQNISREVLECSVPIVSERNVTREQKAALTRPMLMRMLDLELYRRKLMGKDTIDLFGPPLYPPLNLRGELKGDYGYSIAQICKIEYETFGYMVSRHPLEFFNTYAKNQTISPARELQQSKGRRVRAIGWLMTSKRIRTRKGDIMKFLSFEDLTGTFEAVIFPREYEKYAPLTISMGPYFIEGYVDKENGDTITVKKLAVLSANRALRAEQFDDAENVFKSTEKIDSDEFKIIEEIHAEWIYSNSVRF